MIQRHWVYVTLSVLFLGAACSGEGASSTGDTCVADCQTATDASPLDGGDDLYQFQGPDWYRDVVFYQIWVRSYMDSNGDGIGDLRGIIQKLDYIKSLSVGALWLSPFYPTPYFDSGYDVADYRAIDPAYGTLEDFKELLAQAHARGLRVFSDLVMNHTSSQHPWFVESSSGKDNPKQDWYIWADEPNLPCKPQFGFGDNPWTLVQSRNQYYFHQFYPQQPDLNYRNPEVADAMLDVARFWLDLGVDGFRVDAIYTLFEDLPGSVPDEDFVCAHHPLTHQYLQRLRSLLSEYPQKASLAEVWGGSKITGGYFGDGGNEFHMALSFDIEAGIQSALMVGVPAVLLQKLEVAQAALPAGGQYGLFLSSHDWARVMESVGGDLQRAKLAAVLLMTLPGTPILYYGDEVAVGGGTDVVVDKRDYWRTPMPWDQTEKVGFTTGTPWISPSQGQDKASVAVQESDPDSVLNLYRKLIALRNRLAVFGSGSFEALPPPGKSGKVLVFARQQEARVAVVCLNFSGAEQTVTLDLTKWLGAEAATELFSGETAPASPTGTEFSMTLGPWGFAVVSSAPRSR